MNFIFPRNQRDRRTCIMSRGVYQPLALYSEERRQPNKGSAAHRSQNCIAVGLAENRERRDRSPTKRRAHSLTCSCFLIAAPTPSNRSLKPLSSCSVVVTKKNQSQGTWDDFYMRTKEAAPPVLSALPQRRPSRPPVPPLVSKPPSCFPPYQLSSPSSPHAGFAVSCSLYNSGQSTELCPISSHTPLLILPHTLHFLRFSCHQPPSSRCRR
jgi:hypothetical protein